MSTPRLNVTFWDKPNNGYTRIQEKYQQTIIKIQKSFAMKITIVIILLMSTYLTNISIVANAILPFFAVAGVHFWHALFHRGSLTAEMTHGLFCASVFGEIIGGAAVAGFGSRTIIHSVVLALTSLFLGQEPTLMMYACCRLFLWACVPWIPDMARSFLCYLSSLGGLFAAKYVESFLVSQIIPEMRLATPRRRRTSNNSLYNVYKVRRTSLPALGGSNKYAHHPFGFQQHITAPLKHDVMKSFERYEALKRMSIYTPTIIIGYLMIKINEEYWKIRGLMGMTYKVKPVFSSLVNN